MDLTSAIAMKWSMTSARSEAASVAMISVRTQALTRLKRAMRANRFGATRSLVPFIQAWFKSSCGRTRL